MTTTIPKKLFDQNIAIHCKTLEQAKELCKILDANGWEWCNGESYVDKNRWLMYGENMTYHPLSGTYCGIHYFENNNYEVVRFEDIKMYSKFVEVEDVLL